MGEEQMPMDFSEALRHCKNGYAIQRQGWNGKDLWVRHVGTRPGGEGKVCLPYLEMGYPSDHPLYGGCLVPWLASQTDILAEDWIIVNDWEKQNK